MDLVHMEWPRTKDLGSVGYNCNGVKGTSWLEQQWCISCGVTGPCGGSMLRLLTPSSEP